jgi:hypothetical protein
MDPITLGALLALLGGAAVAKTARVWHGYTLAELSHTSKALDNTPPIAVWPSLWKTSALAREIVDTIPGAHVTSVYRNAKVTEAIWPYYPLQPPKWDYHQAGQAMDIGGDRAIRSIVLEYAQACGDFNAEIIDEDSANHIHLAWK